MKTQFRANPIPVPPVAGAPLDGFLPDSMTGDEESLRRGRLQVRFGVLGGAMAVVYSAFFFFLGHYWGGAIVATCGLVVMQVPWIVKKTGNLSLGGHVYGAVLMFGLTALCVVSGGLRGSAYAWMASVPACVLLLMNLRAALWWSGICFAMVVTFAALDYREVGFPITYSESAEMPIEAAGNIGLVLFLGFLALLFEKSRMEAFERLERVNEQLEVTNRELVELNRQKNEFLNVAANDLQNPLSLICDYADLLRELESPTLEDIQEKSADILRSGTLMLETIRNILDVRRIEDGRIRFSRVRCDVGEIAADIFSRYEPIAERKMITFDNTLGPNPPEAYADPEALRQVLDNLVSNAVKFTPSHGSVWISVQTAAEEVVLEVSDTGPGLSREDQPMLWEKFVRLTPQPTGDESSVGLGLWIVKRLSEAMDGRVYCRSVEGGGGSTFFVRLPLWVEQEEYVVPPMESEGTREEIGNATAFERLLVDIRERATAKSRARDRLNDEDVVLPG